MNQHQLNNLATKLANELWGLKLNIPVMINGRMKRAFGRFIHTRLGTAKRIELSSDLINYDSQDHIEGVLKHELCHWALFTMRKPFHDGHPLFESELRRIGAPSTRTMDAVGQRYRIACSKCGRECGAYATERAARNKENNWRYTSRCCKAPLKYVGGEVRTRDGMERKTRAVANEPAPTPPPAPQKPLDATGTITAADLANSLGLDPKALRKKLRASGMKKDGGSWTFTPQQVEEIKKMLGK